MKEQRQHECAGEGAQQLHVQRQRDQAGAGDLGDGAEEEVQLGQHPREAGDNLEQEDTGDDDNLKIGSIKIGRSDVR